MKKLFLLLFALLGITSLSYSQQQALSKIGSPDVLWNQNIADKLVGNNYVSTIKKSPIKRALPTIPDKTAYAFLLDNNEPPQNMGMISFQMPKPDVYSLIRGADMSTAIYTGVGVEEVYYAFMVRFSASGFAFPTELATIDLTTGEKKTVCSLEHLGQFTFSDMTYDYSTGTVYATANTEGMFKSALFKFSLSDGTYEKVCVMDGTYMVCIACNYDGQLYGIGTGGGLYKIDKVTGKIELIGNTGYMPWFIQSMEFDHTDNKLYWSGADSEHTFLAQVDIETGAAMEIGTFVPFSNMTGLYIPFTRVKPGGPGKVTNMTVTPGQKGELNATLKWENPVTDPFGEILTGTMGVKIYRDSELIANMTGKKPGESCELYDNEIISRGNYTYRIVTYNDVSEGESVKQKIWIGEDTPASPVNISLQVNNGTVKIKWEVPDVGKNGGWVNHARLTSKVYCVEDNNRLVAETNEYNCVDEKLTSLKKWSYKIVVMDIDGNSSEAVSDYILAGPAMELPFFDDFQSDQFDNLWSNVNINNDTLLWKRTTTMLENGNYFLQYKCGYYTPASEIAFTPPIKLNAGRDYKISFDAKIFRMRYTTEEKLAILISESPNLEVKADTIVKFTMQDYETNWNKKEYTFSPKSDGSYYIGLYLYSDANQNYVCVDNWKIEEFFYYDLQAVSINGASSALTGIGSEFDATIFNKGSKDVSSYSIQLIDENGNPLSEEMKVNETIKSGETKTHSLMWVPSETGEKQVAFEIKYDTDGDTSNNKSSAIKVNVQSSSVYEVQMGEVQGLSNLPFAQDYKGPIYTQSIYNKREINSISGLIKELTWYTEGIEVLPADMDVNIYLANTDKTDVADGDIPLEEMTHVYSGKIHIEKEQREIKITLDNAFFYEGRNLAVHVGKENQGSETYGWRNGFWFYRETGNTAPTMFKNSLNKKIVKDYKPVLRMKLNSSGNKVSGKVTDTDNNPLQGVEVYIPTLGMKTETNESGEYVYELVNQGQYEIKYSLKGYYDLSSTIDVPQTSDTPVVKDVTLEKMETCDVDITVTNPAGEAISGAKVKIDGYESRDMTTDSEGKVVFDNLVRDDYSVIVEAEDYQEYTADLELKGNKNNSASYQLLPNAYPVSNFNVNMDNKNITWEQPVRVRNIRYDNDVLAGRCGISEDETNEYSVFGISVNETGTVKKIKWYLYGENGEKERTVNLYIFYMAEDGYPEKTPVYTKRGVVSELNKWFEYKLEEEFKAEKNFFVALSCSDSYLGLGIDSGSNEGEEYPWRSKDNFFTSDYRSHYYYASIWYRGNFMIRVDMTDLNPTVLPTQSLIEGYNVYRMKYEDREDKEKWENISTQTGTSFTDSEFQSLPQGYYMYGITSQWKGAGESEVEYSDVIEKDMMTKVTIKVSSNVNKADVLNGTSISLTSKTGEKTYSSTIKDGNNSCVIDNVEKGTYTLTIINPRFDIISQEISPDKDSEYTFGEYKLIESLTEPVNILVEEKEENTGIYSLQWNRTSSYFEDFESHEDFALNSAGKIGWSYLDNDDNESTYGLSYDNKKLEYDNWGARTAYIVFNPSATNPRSDGSSELSPWSGDKFLGSFSASTGANDDFIISPELFFNEDFTFSFYAKSYTTIYGPDKMMVGYSLTDIEPESFIWIGNGEHITLTGYWADYIYTIPAAAKYVCIRCISNNSFLFMVDDIQIGDEKSKPYATYAKSYEIYLDDKFIGTTEADTYEVKAGNGSHTIGLKAIYETGKSEMAIVRVDNTPSSISEAQSVPEVAYAERKLIFNGTAENVSVYSASGYMIRNYTDIENTVNLEDLDPGFYMATVFMGGEEHVVKFIIEK